MWVLSFVEPELGSSSDGVGGLGGALGELALRRSSSPGVRGPREEEPSSSTGDSSTISMELSRRSIEAGDPCADDPGSSSYTISKVFWWVVPSHSWGPSRVGGSAGGPSIGTSFAWVELETRVREGLGMQDGTVILIVPGGAG